MRFYLLLFLEYKILFTVKFDFKCPKYLKWHNQKINLRKKLLICHSTRYCNKQYFLLWILYRHQNDWFKKKYPKINMRHFYILSNIGCFYWRITDKEASSNYVDRIFEIPPPPVYVDKKVYRKCIYIKNILKNFKVQNWSNINKMSGKIWTTTP